MFPCMKPRPFAAIGWPQMSVWAFNGNDDGRDRKVLCRSFKNELSQGQTTDCGCNPGGLEATCSRRGRLHCPCVVSAWPSLTHRRTKIRHNQCSGHHLSHYFRNLSTLSHGGGPQTQGLLDLRVSKLNLVGIPTFIVLLF